MRKNINKPLWKLPLCDFTLKKKIDFLQFVNNYRNSLFIDIRVVNLFFPKMFYRHCLKNNPNTIPFTVP